MHADGDWQAVEGVLSKHMATRVVESESRSRKEFEPEESESQKILTTPTPA